MFRNFYRKFRPCSGIFAANGDSRGRHVLDPADMEMPPSPAVALMSLTISLTEFSELCSMASRNYGSDLPWYTIFSVLVYQRSTANVKYKKNDPIDTVHQYLYLAMVMHIYSWPIQIYEKTSLPLPYWHSKEAIVTLKYHFIASSDYGSPTLRRNKLLA